MKEVLKQEFEEFPPSATVANIRDFGPTKLQKLLIPSRIGLLLNLNYSPSGPNWGSMPWIDETPTGSPKAGRSTEWLSAHFSRSSSVGRSRGSLSSEYCPAGLPDLLEYIQNPILLPYMVLMIYL